MEREAGVAEANVALSAALAAIVQVGEPASAFGDFQDSRVDFVERDGVAAIDELLLFRRMMMIRPGVHAADFVYLRGVTEDAWQRLLRLPFANEPEKVLERLLDEGAEHYLNAYGADYREGQNAARVGIPTLMRWAHP